MKVAPAFRPVDVQTPRAAYWNLPPSPPVALQVGTVPSPAPRSELTTATCRSWCKVGGGLALACGLMVFGVAPTGRLGAPAAGAKSAPAPAPKPAGPSPFTDYRSERPGKPVRITPADLPAPRVTKSVD